MLLNLSIVFISRDSKKVCRFIEVLKSLIYPFIYQGLIIPYDSSPAESLLSLRMPFIIGNYNEYLFIGVPSLDQQVDLVTAVINLDEEVKNNPEENQVIKYHFMFRAK